ncbi:MAG: asparagine synthase (glutamine-hydrolyzing) [Bryobacterales bacterium]|nr:asparagine synthase (glutamine-hydrolyzing) [Bryobacterales bacterium]MBV9401772.1 asparagine synthase (glutamine-hydrolyzing) [Bryobacterales bacterium]
MCAICGILNFDLAKPVDAALIRRMTRVLSHRGPDDEGFYIRSGVGLGHRRLSVIDLDSGQQPIFNEDRSAVIVFNGEVYNYQELATELEAAGHSFETRSDTETILHAYEDYGESCVDRLRGMFAFAIWDARERRLFIARDRLGKKPLYYYAGRDFFAFASEIKALLEIPEVPREVDPDSLDLYLSLRYVPGPRTMFKNVYCLQPGHLMVVDRSGIRTQRPYWDIEFPAAGEEDREQPARQRMEEFRNLLSESVRLRMIAEVPLGVFLSGGLDSTAILAQATALRGPGERMKTFSIGYDGPGTEGADELEYARIAARAFHAAHHEYKLKASEFEAFVPDLVWHLDEPMADASCIPLYYISKLAREHITVVLSGEGADEILAGYAIYRRMLTLERVRRGVPGIAAIAPLLARLAPGDKLGRYLLDSAKPIERRYQSVDRGPGFEGKRKLIGDDRAWKSELQLRAIFDSYFSRVAHASTLNKMLYVDAKVWLPDDLLNKADKMTMANGLELRVPFLDHQLVEFAANLPESAKIAGGNGKALLRESMKGFLPEAILKRPKKGFPVPLSPWLRGPLRPFVRDRLCSPGSAFSNYMDGSGVVRLVEEHEAGIDRSQELWTLIVFESWERQFTRPALEREFAV